MWTCPPRTIVKKIESNAGVTVDWDLIPPQNYADAVNPRLVSWYWLARYRVPAGSGSTDEVH